MPERLGGGPVVDAGAHQRAEARALQHEIEHDHDRKAEPDDEQAIGRIGDAEQVDRAVQHLRLRHVLGQIAVGDADQVGAHVDDADGQQHLRQVPAFFGTLEQDEIEQHADRGGDQRRQRQRDPERSAELRERERHIGGEHVDRAVRQVEIVHQAEHDRQPDGEQEQQHRELQRIQNLFGEKLRVEEHRFREDGVMARAAFCTAVGLSSCSRSSPLA